MVDDSGGGHTMVHHQRHNVGERVEDAPVHQRALPPHPSAYGAHPEVKYNADQMMRMRVPVCVNDEDEGTCLCE